VHREAADVDGRIAGDRQHLERLWSGGLSSPLQVIEQTTYLIFIKRIDAMQERRRALRSM